VLCGSNFCQVLKVGTLEAATLAAAGVLPSDLLCKPSNQRVSTVVVGLAVEVDDLIRVDGKVKESEEYGWVGEVPVVVPVAL